MREITTHRCGSGPNEQLGVRAHPPLEGEAVPDHYSVYGKCYLGIFFGSERRPGVSEEALLAVVLDRLEQRSGADASDTLQEAAEDVARALRLLHCYAQKQARARQGPAESTS